MIICQACNQAVHLLVVAESGNTAMVRCTECGKLQLRRVQTMNGYVRYPDGLAGSVVECSGEIECGPSHPEPPKSDPCQ
jgi:hypothetical protein